MRTHRWCTRCPLIHQYKLHGYAPSVRIASWRRYSFGPAVEALSSLQRRSQKALCERSANFDKLFHLVLSVLPSTPQSTCDVGGWRAMGIEKKQLNSLPCSRED